MLNGVSSAIKKVMLKKMSCHFEGLLLVCFVYLKKYIILTLVRNYIIYSVVINQNKEHENILGAKKNLN